MAYYGHPNDRSLRFDNIQQYTGTFPINFREPSEIGRFCHDGNRQFIPDSSNVAYLTYAYHHRNRINLSQGFHETTHRDELRFEGLISLLTWIVNNLDKVGHKPPDADFVCYRRLLTRVLSTPYERFEPWIICCTKFQGTYYLLEFDSDKRSNDKRNTTQQACLMSSWGYKFEQHMTSSAPNGYPNLTKPLNENEDFNVVAKTHLAAHSILFGAEVDCIDPRASNQTPPKCYVELKTSKDMDTFYQQQNFKKKTLKWWLQSFLLGVPKIVCGFRNDAGFVIRVQEFQTASLPSQAGGFWDGTVCFKFGEAFLDFVRRCAVKDSPHVVYKFECNLNAKEVTCVELSQEASAKYQVLPPWYVNRLQNCTRQ